MITPAARLAGVLMAAALASSGCAPTPRGPLEPLVVGTERYLLIQWQLERRGETVVVWGYVNNDSPYTFDRVRVLVDALDPIGQIISQRIVWAMGVLGGGGATTSRPRWCRRPTTASASSPTTASRAMATVGVSGSRCR